MLFKDYFKDTDKVQQAKELKNQKGQELYDFYIEYATEKLDGYSKKPNIWITVKGFNFVDKQIDNLDTINVYGPKCFDNAGVMLMLLHSEKVAQIWNNHTFINGKEVEPFKADCFKSLYDNYNEFYQFLDSKY